MKTNDATRATAEAVPSTRPLDYRDLESEMLTAANMAEIACDRIESAQGKYNKVAHGFHVSDGEMRLINFAIYHTSDLVNALVKRWNEVHENNIHAKGGAS